MCRAKKIIRKLNRIAKLSNEIFKYKELKKRYKSHDIEATLDFLIGKDKKKIEKMHEKIDIINNK